MKTILEHATSKKTMNLRKMPFSHNATPQDDKTKNLLTTTSPARSVRRPGQPLDDVLSPGDLHDGHTGDLAQPPLEILVVGSDNIDARLGDTVEDAVVGVDALVLALEDLEVLALGYAEGKPVLGPEFFQLWGIALVSGQDGRQGKVGRTYRRGRRW